MILMLTLLLPLIGAAIIYFTELSKKGVALVACGSVILAMVSAAICAPTVLDYGRVYEEYAWIPELGFNFDLMADGLSLAMVFAILIISSASLWFSYSYEKELRGFSIGVLLFISAMIGVVLSTNMFQFYFFWEAMIIPAYFIISGFGEGKYKGITAMKFFVFMHIGALLVLFSFVWIYSVKGTADFIHLDMEGVPAAVPILIFVGFCIKMGIFPFHNWLPDAHSEAPAPFSALLSGMMVGLGGYAIIRILMLTLTLPPVGIVITMALFTMLYGGIMAVAQTDIKRLLAYSTISQMGYVLLGIAVLSPIGAAMQIFAHSLFKSLLFLTAGAIVYSIGTRDMKKLGGLNSKLPKLFAPALIGVLALIGLPPMVPFVSEVMIFESIGLQTFALLFAISAGVVTAGYGLIFLQKIFFGKPVKVKELPSHLWLPLVVLALALILFGIFPETILNLVRVMA
jgi:NADH-quinone oxidoreductase subunit M